MKEFLKRHDEVQIQLLHLGILCKWIFLSGVTGLFVGLVATAFSYSMTWATTLRLAQPLILGLLPVGGILVVWLYHRAGYRKSRGTNLIISSIRNEESLSFRIAPLIFISTVITHLLGGSAGREGAALQLGGSMGASFGRLFHLNSKDLKLITMCGMSAAFTALFGTPLTATIFAMEVISVGIIHYAALIPCAFASIVALQVANYLGLAGEHFLIQVIPQFSLSLLVKVSLLAILCSYVSILFCWSLHHVSSWMKKAIPNPYFRIMVGGSLILILSILVGTDYNGAGMNIIARAIEESRVQPFAFLLKIIFTAITLGCGFKGGEIVPSFFVGACFGCLVAPWLGISASFGAAIGLMVVFCGVTNCPMASLFLAFELFGFHSIVFFLFADAIGYMMSGYYGLYSEQKIVYSKYEPSYIDQKTN